MSTNRLKELEAQIRSAQKSSGESPKSSLLPRIIFEYTLNLIPAVFIGYVIDSFVLMVKNGMGTADDYNHMCTWIMAGIGFLSGTYRSWRIFKGKNPDGEVP